jgi:hypothetical protein
MPSSWSSSLRFELQFTGENINLWGDKLNTELGHADDAVPGVLTKALSGDTTLSTATAGDDEARAAILKFTGAGPFTVTVPSVSKAYAVWNSCTAAVTLTTGAGAAVAAQPGEIVQLVCDGANVVRVQGTAFGGQPLTGLADPTSPQMAATKAYADQLAFTANAGILPGQTGNDGRFIRTDGTNASWQPISSADLTDNAAFLGRAVALAVVL